MSENNIVNSNADVQESTATAEATATTNAPVQTERVVTAHDDFDWTIDKRNVAAYTKEEKEKYDNVYDNTFVTITDGELVKGLVVQPVGFLQPDDIGPGFLHLLFDKGFCVLTGQDGGIHDHQEQQRRFEPETQAPQHPRA